MAEIKSRKLTKSYKLEIAGELTITQSVAFHKALKQAAKQSNPVVIDLNKMSGIDLNGLQLLCAMHQTCIQKKRQMILKTDQLDWLKDTLNVAGFSQVDCALKEKDGCFRIAGGKR